MSRSISNFTAGVVLALASPTLACSPAFPNTIIDRRDGLLAAPFIHFADSVAKIPSPPATFRAVNPAKNQSPGDQSRAVELADLAAVGVAPESLHRHEVRRATLARIEPPSPGGELPAELARTDGLPVEFALYYEGVFFLAQNDASVAAERFRRLLSLDEASRRYKSTWAAFMLGRLYEDEAPEKARDYFQQVRQLAQAGFRDPLGLAASSLGWEAKTHYEADDFLPAARLYLEQAVTGDASAANSLRFLARRLLEQGTAGEILAFAGDARLREIPTALLIAEREQRFSGPLDNRATERWLAALEQAGARGQAPAAPLALAAYRGGQFSACERWLRLAPRDSGLALWLRAKLALRDGEVDRAADLLAQLVRRSASGLEDLVVFENSDSASARATAHIRAELGTLRLARQDYTEALGLLIEAGYEEDAAYVAERVLSVDELKVFVETRLPSIPTPHRYANDGPFEHSAPPLDFRALLARRLVRYNRLEEARPFFPAAFASSVDRFIALLHAGRNPVESTTLRSIALMDAARMLKSQGMELRGTELGPDFTIWEGQSQGLDLLVQRVNLPRELRPSPDEYTRASTGEPGVAHRFHYRYLAADLAWEAASLMPDQQESTAHALIEAAAWLKNRDPRAANRFYLALVKRCGETPQGRAAAAKHWFP